MYGQLGMVPYMQMPSTYSRVPLPSDALVEEQPTYVNAKQYRRIIKRRQARALLEKKNAIPTTRKNYLHESRHAHAMRRPRGPGGRFLVKAELEEYKRLLGGREFVAGSAEEKEVVAEAVANVAAGSAGQDLLAPPAPPMMVGAALGAAAPFNAVAALAPPDAAAPKKARGV